MLDEILKYPKVVRIDYVELNPYLIRMVSGFNPVNTEPRIHLNFADGRKFIMGTNEKYDVVIVALPDPSSLQLNRLYTMDFLSLLKEKLNHSKN